VISTRRLRFQHVKCDLDTHNSDWNMHECDLNMHECYFKTISVNPDWVLTSGKSVILTRYVFDYFIKINICKSKLQLHACDRLKKTITRMCVESTHRTTPKCTKTLDLQRHHLIFLMHFIKFRWFLENVFFQKMMSFEKFCKKMEKNFCIK
jgi:hypothetical protein